MSKEYVLIGFSDGDARVYDAEAAEEQMKANGDSALIRTDWARGTDRKALVEMAVLARGNRGRHMVDMTDEGYEYVVERRPNNVRAKREREKRTKARLVHRAVA